MSDLSALLDREASAEIEALLSEARQRASEIVAEANAEAEQHLAQRRRAADAQRDATLVRAQSAAQLEAAALKLRAQHAGVEAVFDAVRTELGALRGDAKRYPAVLRALLAEAVDAVGADDVVAVHAAPADVAAVREAAKALGLSAEVAATTDLEGGVRVATRGQATVENSLGERLDALAGDLAAQVSRTLFAPSSEA
ncbi:MAG: V-type ATP synthase subunit E [Trueperaceae bacterium]|nr:V-type ATP synthase subunit E [Trueperaceae bacterium]